jgi:hypothetical protein
MTAVPELDWKAPLNADGRARPAALREALGVETPELERLLSQLENELSADAWGFARLSDLEDEQRAQISDQFLSAAYGLQDALTDVSISLREVHQHTGPNGIAYPASTDTLDDVLREQQLRRGVATFFGAIGTALDCLAAVLVVITRAPISVQRADFGQLRNLDPDAHHRAFDGEVPDDQRKVWRGMLEVLAEAEAQGPGDWLDWSLAMRNALTHRGRVTNIHLPRPISGLLAVPPTSEPQSLYRYDLFLRRRPWLPEIEGMLAATRLPDSVLDEPVGRTVDGLRSALQSFTETAIAWGRRSWDQAPADLIAPVSRWALPTQPDLGFLGTDPGGTTPISGAVGAINQEHLRLAERLRKKRVGKA